MFLRKIVNQSNFIAQNLLLLESLRRVTARSPEGHHNITNRSQRDHQNTTEAIERPPKECTGNGSLFANN